MICKAAVLVRLPFDAIGYTDATEVTRRMIAELIDHIDVYHQEKLNGVATQRLTIYYNCIGAFPVPDRQGVPEPSVFMETRKGVALQYAPSKTGT